MVDTSTSPAVGYMEVVPQRNAATLLPIILAHTQPGTIIHSDQWRAYNQVNTLPNVASHSTVNHSIEFVDPVTGTHTQNVESYWNRVKIRFKEMKGCHESQLPSYLDEFMWRERFGSTASSALDSIVDHIAEQYPVWIESLFVSLLLFCVPFYSFVSCFYPFVFFHPSCSFRPSMFLPFCVLFLTPLANLRYYNLWIGTL